MLYPITGVGEHLFNKKRITSVFSSFFQLNLQLFQLEIVIARQMQILPKSCLSSRLYTYKAPLLINTYTDDSSIILVKTKHKEQ